MGGKAAARFSSPCMGCFHWIWAVKLRARFFLSVYEAFLSDMGGKAVAYFFLPVYGVFSSDMGGKAGGPFFPPRVRVVFIGYLR